MESVGGDEYGRKAGRWSRASRLAAQSEIRAQGETSPLAIHESGYYLHADFSFEFGSHLHEFSFCYTVNS